MLILLSPAKTLNYDIQPQTETFSQPEYAKEAETLVNQLRKYSPAQLQKLMRINSDLASLNVQRYQNWHLPFDAENAKQALLVFKGEVYNGIKADTFSEDDLLFAQDRMRILSGLYGALRPLDLMQPYRLEMGTKMKVGRKKDLYHFWGDKITDHVRQLMQSMQQKVLVNLASNEYFKSIDTSKLDARVITPVFKDYKNGVYKFITVYGKNARGMLSRFIIKNRITDVENLKLFDEAGYYYNDRMSEGDQWVFTRG